MRGPYDPSDRFTYWPQRVAQGGEVLAPGLPETPIQVIDVRDLAEWIIAQVEARRTGIFNATGPQQALEFGELLQTCKSVSGSTAELTWSMKPLLAQA